MLIIGIILLVIGVILNVVGYAQNNKILKLKLADVQPVKDILEVYKDVASDMGGMTNESMGSVAAYGNVECAAALTAPMTDTACVYYSFREEYQVERKEVHTTEDREGNTQRRTETKREWRTSSSDKKFREFKVNDGTGAIAVNPEGMTFDLKHNTKVETAPVGGYENLADGFRDIISNMLNSERIIAQRRTETIVPVGFKVFVTGAIKGTSTGLTIANPKEKKEQFILADRSQDSLIKDVQFRQKMQFIFGIILSLGGIGLTIAGIIK